MSVCSFYLTSQREVFAAGWRRRVKYLPAVLSVGIGLSLNNAKAVIEGLLGHASEFVRTPKHCVEAQGEDWRIRRYRGSTSVVPFLELGLAVYFAAMAYYALANGIFGTLPFILLFHLGFLYSGAMSLLQGFSSRLELFREQEA